jgi:hypothetical protein
MGDVTVHLKPAGSPWSVAGKGLYPGLLPANVRVDADTWGFATCSFEIPRDPFLPQPDLTAFTPCVIEESGSRLFEGKVMETPTRSDPQMIQVTGKGYQYALDENPIEYYWKHSDLSAWQDVRSIPGYDPAIWRPSATCEVGEGSITIGRGQGTTWFNGEAQGVYLDVGPAVRVKRIEISFRQINLATNTVFNFFVRGRNGADIGDSPFGTGDAYFGGTLGQTTSLTFSPAYRYVDSISQAAGAIVAGDTIGYFTPPARVIAIFMYWVGAGGVPTGLDHIIILDKINLYGDVVLGAGTQGNLRASDVVESVGKRASASGIVVPSQAPSTVNIASNYKDELWTLSQDMAGISYWHLDPTGGQQLVPTWGSTVYHVPDQAAANLVQSPNVPTYNSTGGPLVAETLSPRVVFDGANLKYLKLLPANHPFDDVHGWAFSLWFKTSTAGTTGADWRAVNNRIVSLETQAGLPPAGTKWWGIGIGTSGNLVGGTVTSGGAISTTTFSQNYADGQWHHLFVTMHRNSGGFVDWKVDELGDDGGGFSAATTTDTGPIDPARDLHIGTRGGGDVWFTGEIAEFAFWQAEIPVGVGKHLYRAGRRQVQTSLERTKLKIPGLATTSGPRVGREIIEGVNIYHRYASKIGRDRELVFKPQAFVPKYALTSAASLRFEQPSLIAAEEAYNRVVVSGVTGFNVPVRVERVAAHQPGAVFESPGFNVINPSLDVDASGWLPIDASTIARSTLFFHTAPAALRILAGSGAGQIRGAMALFPVGSKFLRGRLYRITYYARTLTAGIGFQHLAVFGLLDNGDYGSVVDDATTKWDTTFKKYTIDWIPRQDVVAPSGSTDAPLLWVESSRSRHATQAPVESYIDTVELNIGVGSILDRQNDLRSRTIDFNQPMTSEVGVAIGDAFMQSRARQQLRGSIDVGPGDIVSYASGQQIHPCRLVEDTNEFLHIPSLVDPDTGAQGRDGKMVQIGYDPQTERATLSIDNSRDNFEVLMSRFGLINTGSAS